MRMNKFKIGKKLFLSVLLTLLTCCVFLGYSLFGQKKADALSAVPTSTSVTDPIYDFDSYCYSESALNQMAQKILGDSSKTFKDLIDYVKRVGNAGEPIANKELTLKYGRYRFNSTTVYKQLVWLPVYLSTSRDGDAILTLYLAATEATLGSTSRQEVANWSENGTYSTDVSCGAPTNSYGTSYLRAWALGNGGMYAGYDTSHSINYSSKTASIKTSDWNKFSDFVQGSDFTGTFYDDIVTPADIVWQETESYVDYLGKWGSYEYCWPNEAYGKPASGSYYLPNNYDYLTKDKVNYTSWKDDKVWLPSLTEVGTGNIDANGVDTTNGIWKLTNSQRSNKIKSYLRTANTSTNATNVIFCTSVNGSSYDTATVSSASANYGIRPAIHLNLNKISTKTIAPVNLPDTITVTYNGENQSIANASSDQISWYDPDTMSVYYYEDETMIRSITPVDNGEYYILVALRDNRYFLGQDTDKKTKGAKFIVEKVKFGVSWTYNSDGTPSEVIPNVEWYERDVEANNVPKVGIMYNSIGTGGLHNWTEFPEIKDTYRASPYIINEDTHRYNYELLPDEKSNAFIVSEHKVNAPVFSIGGGTSLTLTYRSTQEVQFTNVTKYITIECSDSKVEDMGVDLVNGIQTFKVNTVGTYYFTVKLKDTVNTMWAEGGYLEKTYTLTIDWAKITVNFDNLPSSWASNTEQTVNISILGIYGSDDIDNINLSMTYYGTTGGEINVPKNSAGKFVIPKGLKVGTYTLVVRMALSSNYYLAGDMKTQKFTIVAAPSDFNDDDVYWQYTLSGSSVSTLVRDSGDGKDGSTPEKAFEVNYTGLYYQFSLTMEEVRLADLGVRATYTGDTRVSAGGSYKVTVTISAYDKNVIYNTKSYSIYFKILKATYDLTDIKWTYDGTPFTYNGEEQKVMIDPDTLPEGLTVTYVTNSVETNSAINAGNYTTAVMFAVGNDFAANYEVPVAGLPDTYINTGDKFSFTCPWVIERQAIIIEWNSGDDVEDSDIFFVPVLEIGHSYVDYAYEKLTDGAWTSCSSVVSAAGAPETYRATVSLKSEYADNFRLVEDTSNPDSTYVYEFVIGAGKEAVTIHLEVNDQKCEDGDKFVYTGSAFAAKPVVDSGSLKVNEFTVQYYKADANGVKGEAITAAPTAIGYYIATVSIKYENTAGSYLSEASDREVFFEIVKADYDISPLKWKYEHGGVSISAHYDFDQRKWVDDDGKEVIFSFEYDGTEHTLQLIGEVDGLTVSEVSSNVYTEIGDYTAFIRFSTDENYNEPAFPQTLSWKITKATLNVDKVQWGYIDESGNEYEFNFDEDSFEYFRDNNGDRVYRVGLIYLPEQLKSHIRYTTTSSTTGEITSDNSASQVGVYKTTYAFSGTFTDDHYESFSVSNMPVTLPTYLFWEINSRTLTKPEFTNGWAVFDNKTHDLIELSGMPSEELYFFTVEITFKDGFGIIHSDYEGYEGEKYIGFHAGTYTVGFYQIVQSEKVLWGNVTFTIEKAKLTVAWDNQGSIPLARVSGISVSDMLGTKYTNQYGDEVTMEYILSTDGVQFYAEPYILPDYAGNIQYVMQAGVDSKYSFVTEHFTPDSSTISLERPQLTFTSREYTGSEITFAIGNWSAYFSKYLYISDGSLSQTEVGKYSVIVSFIKEANAIWEGTESNRDAYKLEFEITNPTHIYLKKPILQFKKALYTGEPIEFIIQNWVEYRQYLYISVGKLTQTNVAVYTVVLNFYEDSIGCWEDGSKDPCILQFEIVSDPSELVETVELYKPVFQFDTATYTGGPITFVIVNWDTQYKEYLDIVGTLTQTNVADYSVTLRFKEGANACWAGTNNDRTPITLYFSIKESTTSGDQKVALYKPTLKTDSASYTGSPITFEINNWNELYSQYLTYTGDLTKINAGVFTITFSFKPNANAYWIGTENDTSDYSLSFEIIDETGTAPIELTKPALTTATAVYTGSAITFEISKWESYSKYLHIVEGSLTQTAVGDYSVILEFIEGTNAFWEGTDNDRSSFKLDFSITEAGAENPPLPGGVQNLGTPAIIEAYKEYTGKPIKFEISNWDSIYQYVSLLETAVALVKSDVGTYKVTLHIEDPSKAVWGDGTTDDIELTFYITAAVLTELEIGNNGNLSVKSDASDDYSSVIADLYEKGVIDYEYFDSEGNPVAREDLVEGEEYTVKLVIKDSETFNKYFDTSNVKSAVSDVYTITYTPEKGGFDLLLIIGLVCIAVEFVLFIILVVMIKKKQAAAAEEDYEDEDYDE